MMAAFGVPTSRPRRALSIARGMAPVVGDPVRVGYVHSVFRHAANLWLPPDTLLAIASPAAVRAPNVVVVAPPASNANSAFLGLSAGMTLWVGGGLIRVPAAGLCINAADVLQWNPRPRFPNRSIAPDILSRHLDRLAWLIRDCACAKPWSFASILDPAAGEAPEPGKSRHSDACRGLGVTALQNARTASLPEDAHLAPLAQRARTAAHRLIAGIEAGATDAIASGACGLAGLGHGLTPSGDDVLIGVCGALALAAAVLPSPGLRREQAAAIAAAAADRTTLLSVVWLDHAARGEFSAEVGDVLVALADPHGTGLVEAVARLLAVGGSSGLDTATGVLLGSRAALASRCRAA